MNLEKTACSRGTLPGKRRRHPLGFTLIISISLMVLLTVLCVGLLSLSTLSLRASGRTEDLQVARSNARLALALAIGQLQSRTGVDQSITAPANLMGPQEIAGVTGAWKSWRPPTSAPEYDKEKTDRFLGYLISDPSTSGVPDPKTLPSAPNGSEILVGTGSLGQSATASQQVSAPKLLVQNLSGKVSGAMAWVTLDEGMKSRVDLSPVPSTQAVGPAVAQIGAPARNALHHILDGNYLTGKREEIAASVPKLVSFDANDLALNSRNGLGQYFHDLTVTSASVQADVADGGLRTDLSVLFEGPDSPASNLTLPGEYGSRRLYSNATEPFGNNRNAADPTWNLFYNFARLYRNTTAKDGLLVDLPINTKNSDASAPLAQIRDTGLNADRYEMNMQYLNSPVLMPNVVRVDTMFSLITRDVHGGRSSDLINRGYSYMLHLMYLPIITLHNPYNVPIRFNEIELEFADLPVGFNFMVDGQLAATGSGSSNLFSLNQLYVGKENGASNKIFKMVLTGNLDRSEDVRMGPGETRIFGTPFSPNLTWQMEEAGSGADGKTMFDWRNDKTQLGSRVIPGMITGPNEGIGYDVDWLAPQNRAAWLTQRTGEGIIPLKREGNERVSVIFGPKAPSPAGNKFSVTMRAKVNNRMLNSAVTQVFYLNESRLEAIMEEGTSPRFSAQRDFPETWPKPSIDPSFTTIDLYERNDTQIKNYVKARPFAILSLSAKTTTESFTKSRPVTDTGATALMSTVDLTTSASQGSAPMELVMTPVRSGLAAIESDSGKGFFFGGHGSANGSTSATFYEIPLSPLQSVAQFRHLNFGSLGAAPSFTYTVGESRAHPAIPSDTVSISPNSSRMLLDHSWLSNNRLWDSYWFSTLSSLRGPGYVGSESKSQKDLASEFFAGGTSLPNPRMMPYTQPGSTSEEVLTDALEKDGRRSAAYLLTRGGFNVNSTSVDAWISVLSALSDAEVPLSDDTFEVATKDGIPFLRTRRPTAGDMNDGADRRMLWNGYRKLNPDQTRKLAEEIVKEIRTRGPFLSMSEFVNRRLEAAGEKSRSGALQAAIDKSLLNEIVLRNANAITKSDVSSYGWANPDAIDNSTTGAGAPAEITQGDILSAIGSFVTVRSDTFRIRAYGEARNGDNEVTARAWCEAVVQRVPDYLDSRDKAYESATQPVNMTFGRRYDIVSFRWLHQDEV